MISGEHLNNLSEKEGKRMLKVGLWGCGGISGAHRRAYDLLENKGTAVKLTALCDINAENFNKEIKINISGKNESPLPKIEHCYRDIDEMLASEELDVIDVCLPAFLHKEAVIKALNKGINVIVEKPMALSFEDCEEMLSVAKNSSGRLMVAHCVRFDGHFSYLTDAVKSGKYGKLISAEFSRLSPFPVWKTGKSGKDGSVIFDMHIHDVDFVQSLFGQPDEISAVASSGRTACEAVSTVFKYKDAFVNIKGDWSLPQSFEFETPYYLAFEKAMISYDGKENITVFEDGRKYNIEVNSPDAYTNEIEYFADIVINGKKNTVNPPESSRDTIKLIEKICYSAENGGVFVKN